MATYANATPSQGPYYFPGALPSSGFQTRVTHLSSQGQAQGHGALQMRTGKGQGALGTENDQLDESSEEDDEEEQGGRGRNNTNPRRVNDSRGAQPRRRRGGRRYEL